MENVIGFLDGGTGKTGVFTAGIACGQETGMTFEKKTFILSIILEAILGFLISMLVAKNYG